MKKYLFLVFLTLVLFSCKQKQDEETDNGIITNAEADESFSGDPLFHLLSPQQTGIKFYNPIIETADFNFVTFQYIYNGGGVAIGDINNDDLPDIYFTGNTVGDKLYLNKGDMKFEDITDKAGIKNQKGWKNGVTMMDFNEDGWMDIYVCRGGYSNDAEMRRNYLYINNGDLTFTESGAQYKIDDAGFSIQAVYLDYDHDGHLDMYVANHPNNYAGTLTERAEATKNPKYEETDRLYRNKGNGEFENVSLPAGIKEYGHGLGPIIIDINQDGWDDIFVANDFQTPEYIFINNKNGTFTDRMREYTKHCSFYSMGVDVADINFDGFTDLVCVEMMPEDYEREVNNLTRMWEARNFTYLEAGFYHQYLRNVLYINYGNNTIGDVAQLSGIEATDWSWTPLLADFDQDGQIDLFVTNGYLHDTQNHDWIMRANEIAKNYPNNNIPIDVYQKECPSVRLSNYMYRGGGDLKFEKFTKRWGMEKPSFSNGAAWGDLDNDGDLDMVVNNIQDTAFVYENTAVQKGTGNYLMITCKGPEKNVQGLGTSVAVYTGDKRQFQVLYTSRGFLSSSEPILHFGTGSAATIDKIEITWYDGSQQILTDVKSNQQLVVDYNDSQKNLFATYPKPDHAPYLKEESDVIDFTHIVKPFDDYGYSSLFLPQKFSRNGPCIAVADVNGDGIKDLFIGGGTEQPAALFIQKENASFKLLANQPWQNNVESTDAMFFDADGDHDADLYLATGTNIFGNQYDMLADHFYLNDGKGNFELRDESLPPMLTFSSCIDTTDIDGDGDWDLFVGGRMIPDKYPQSPQSYLLRNDNGVFTDITKESAPDLVEAGMITDAVWNDLDGDKKSELIMVGEWMNITAFKNNNGTLSKMSIPDFEKTSGFWNTIEPIDIDNDGDEDFVAGNIGLNYKYSSASAMPLKMYAMDFYRDGIPEAYFAKSIDGKYVPFRTPTIFEIIFENFMSRFGSYENYATLSATEIFGNPSAEYEAWQMASVIIRNDGKGKFSISELPVMAQVSSVNAILVCDINHDGNKDMLLSGNTFDSPVDVGDADAGIGQALIGNGKGEFETLSVHESGFFTPGMVRSLRILPIGKSLTDFYILVGNNGEAVQVIRRTNNSM